MSSQPSEHASSQAINISSGSTGSPTPNQPTNLVTSPPLDPSKLNQQPAPLPMTADPTSPQSLRSPDSAGPIDSAYLDNGLTETPSHPTIAETGELAHSSETGPGPMSGQLKRVKGGEKGQKEIIKMGSFGGEGLVLKPPMGSPPPK